MPSVVFDPAYFKARYPEFATVTDMTLSTYFAEATLYLSNGDGSRVSSLTKRATLLNMLVAHIGYLAGALGDGTARPVGRVSQGAEGSVSASFEDLTPGSAAWYQQSQYGAAFWNATRSYRSAMYIPCPTAY